MVASDTLSSNMASRLSLVSTLLSRGFRIGDKVDVGKRDISFSCFLFANRTLGKVSTASTCSIAHRPCFCILRIASPLCEVSYDPQVLGAHIRCTEGNDALHIDICRLGLRCGSRGTAVCFQSHTKNTLETDSPRRPTSPPAAPSSTTASYAQR